MSPLHDCSQSGAPRRLSPAKLCPSEGGETTGYRGDKRWTERRKRPVYYAPRHGKSIRSFCLVGWPISCHQPGSQTNMLAANLLLRQDCDRARRAWRSIGGGGLGGAERSPLNGLEEGGDPRASISIHAGTIPCYDRLVLAIVGATISNIDSTLHGQSSRLSEMWLPQTA